MTNATSTQQNNQIFECPTDFYETSVSPEVLKEWDKESIDDVLPDWSDEYELTDEYQLEYGDEDTRRGILLAPENEDGVIHDAVGLLIELNRVGDQASADTELTGLCEVYGLNEANARIVIDEAYSRYDKWLTEQDVSPVC